MKNIKGVTLIATLVLAMGVFAGCVDSGEPTIGDSGKQVLRMGVEDTYPPYEYKNEANETIGFDIDLAHAIAEKLDMELEIVSTSFDGIFTGLNAGNYDVIISAVSMTPGRLENMLFSEPYLSNGQVIVTKKDGINITKHEELTGLNVGVQLGTTADTAAEKYAKDNDFEVIKYDEIIQTFTAIKAGHVDAIAVDYAVAIDYVSNEPESYQVSEVMLTNEPIAVVIKKGNEPLQEKINQALKEIREEGKLKELSLEWLGDDYTSNIDTELEVVE
ncbi:MAG: amino acid ABC transporter substrate-binding protein [Clostridium sp.]|nr:amino acid ABC transporter substrate-binding protein [Clostridium sp.]